MSKRRPVWIEANGARWHVDEMEDGHLINAWKLLDRKINAAPAGEVHPNWTHWRAVFTGEIIRRGLQAQIPGLVEIEPVPDKPAIPLHGGKSLKKLKNARLEFRRK